MIPPLALFNEYSPAGMFVMLVWVLLKLVKIDTKVEAIKDIKKVQDADHDRIVLMKPKVERAHERCDEFKEKFKDNDSRFKEIEKRGFTP